jgi:predicted HTH domain antitoxin
MGTVKVELDEALASLLQEEDRSIEQAARELIVMELYRRATISRGRAAGLLEMPLLDFLLRASALGIPYVEYTEAEWAAELRSVEEVVRERRSSRMPAL